MDLFHANTCLRFVRLNTNDTITDNYAEIVPSNESNSLMGMNVIGVNRVEIRNNSNRIHQLRTITHELAHLVGLYHEHQRPDFMEFKNDLKPISCNAKSEQKPFELIHYKYQKQIQIQLDRQNIKYYFNKDFDLNSITNYYRCFDSTKYRLRFRLSKIDIKKINTLYHCSQLYSRFN